MRSVLFVYAAVISFLVLCVVYIVKNKEFVTTVAFYSTNVVSDISFQTYPCSDANVFKYRT